MPEMAVGLGPVPMPELKAGLIILECQIKTKEHQIKIGEGLIEIGEGSIEFMEGSIEIRG